MTVKRALDVVGAMLGLVLLSPFIAAAAAAVWLSMGRPVLFRQTRPGLGERPFTMVKFRTMANDRDASGRLLSDAERLTRTGRWLRSTSIDELPELWNVLMGEMSLVGPRPLLTSYLGRYSVEQARRHDVKPGITGWAQINGRNSISWEEKFALDVWYVDHQSTWLDAKILFATVLQVIRRRGINSADSATMPEFTGTRGVE
ncbi:sugar transferase [Sphingomonas sp. BK580]|uniref:sugar transferase n=1 Tax=Sphingomonas sp. BK580 TaxID=2586972 RepID=UPI00160B0DDC|nr:sugar transferase [Sphingomonas sp. BK580]MBB3693774.1 lipopolysaccharide/colanic/teichoic acid biosynthesis glycosyltransferase [Sphingomonas sp. BK580]